MNSKGDDILPIELILLAGFSKSAGINVHGAAYKLRRTHHYVGEAILTLSTAYDKPILEERKPVHIPGGFIPTSVLRDTKDFEWAKEEYAKLTGKDYLIIELYPYGYFGYVAKHLFEKGEDSINGVVKELNEKAIAPYEVFAAFNVMGDPKKHNVEYGPIAKIFGGYHDARAQILEGISQKDVEEIYELYFRRTEWKRDGLECKLNFDGSIELIPYEFEIDS